MTCSFAHRTLWLASLVALAPLAFALSTGCYSQQRASRDAPPPAPQAYDVDMDRYPGEPGYPDDDLEYLDEAGAPMHPDLRPEPMPVFEGPLVLLRMTVPEMLCENCERAVAGLVESVPGTQVVEVNHGTDEIAALVPRDATGRVVRVLTTNGWSVEEMEQSRADDADADEPAAGAETADTDRDEAAAETDESTEEDGFELEFE